MPVSNSINVSSYSSSVSRGVAAQPQVLPQPYRPAQANTPTPVRAPSGPSAVVSGGYGSLSGPTASVGAPRVAASYGGGSGATGMAMQQRRQSGVEEIKTLLENREELKMVVIKCFKQSAAHQKKIDIRGLLLVQKALERELNLPSEVFGDLQSEYVRFDFDGSGFLEANEVYKLIKFSLFEYLKGKGAIPAPNLPMKASLEAAGYTVTKKLGEGSQATLNLGCDKYGNQRAIKSFIKGKMQFGSMEEMMEEYEVMQRLACKNVAKTFEIFQDQQYVYMINEVYLGGDLTKLRRQAKENGIPMTEEWWKGIFRQCFEALEFMHQQAMMHCDIKEPNIMVRDKQFFQPEVVLIDLGVAKALTAADNGMCSGTPGYMPPETYDTAKWYPGGDCFSMGVTMVQLLTDNTPDEELAKRGILKGIFLSGCRTIPDIQRATATREPPFAQMPKNMKGLISLTRRLLDKNMRSRPKAPIVLKDPWFAGIGVEDAPVEARMQPENAMATVGITPEMMDAVKTEAIPNSFRTGIAFRR